MAGNGSHADFGFRQVPLSDKQALVDDVFHSVAKRYDLMNDLMSGGLHRAWKDVLVAAVNPPKGDRPFAHLDLAGGTGDVAFRVAKAGGSGTKITVSDINTEMLAVGRERAIERHLDHQVEFVEQPRQLLDGLGAGHHIDQRAAGEELLALLLRDAPGDGDDGIVAALEAHHAQLAEARVELVFRVLAHAARVDDDQAGFGLGFGAVVSG